MQLITWLCPAVRLGMFAIVLIAANGLRADDGPPPGDKESPAAESSKKEPKPELDHVEVRSTWKLLVQVDSVPPALDEQLQLKGEGVLVEDVAADGPAAKAGIKPNDILLSVGEIGIKGPRELAKAVHESDGKPLTIKLLRAGKPETVSVTPEKQIDDVLRHRGPNWEVITQDLEKRIRDDLRRAGGDIRMQFIHPGHVFAQGIRLPDLDFPDDLTVNLRKQGKSPLEIEVKKADQTWTLKTNELDRLPEELRKYVEAVLHGPPPFRALPPFGPGHPGGPPQGPPHAQGPPRGEGPPPGPPHADGLPPGPPDHGPGPPRPGSPGAEHRRPPLPGGPGGGPGFGPPRPGEGPGPLGRIEMRLDRRLDELSRRLEQLRDQLEDVRRGLRDAQPAEKNEDKDDDSEL